MSLTKTPRQIYLLLLIPVLSTPSNLLDQQNNEQETTLVDFAKKTFLQQSKLYKTTLIIRSEEDRMADQFLKEVSQETSMSFLTLNLRNYSLDIELNTTTEKPDMIIFFLDENSNNLTVVLFGIELCPLWNIRANHLFLARGIDEEIYKEWLKEGFDFLFDKQAYKAVVTFFLGSEFKLFTYDPFLVKYNIDITKDSKEELFKQVRNMKGYELKTYHFDEVLKNKLVIKEENGKRVYGGMDGKYVSTAVEALNATLIIHNLSEDFDKSLIDNVDGSADVASGIVYIRASFDLDILFNNVPTYPHYHFDHVFLNERNDFLILVPSGAKIPQYLYLFSIVPVVVLIPTLGVMFVVSFVTWMSHRLLKVRVDCLVVLADNWRILLNSSTPNRRRGQHERLLLILWLYFCLIFDTLFTSILTSTLIKPKYYDDIDTLQQLYQTDIKVIIYGYYEDNMMNKYLTSG